MIVNAIWIGDELPLLQRMCLNSWTYHGFTVCLWTYHFDVRGVPPEVMLCDAREILSGEILRYEDKRHAGSPVLHANIFRYEFLYQRGGTFIDADTLCRADFKPRTFPCISTEGKEKHPNLAFIHLPTSHSYFAKLCLRRARAQLEGAKNWGQFGPKIVKETIEMIGLQSWCCDPFMWCPIHWSESSRIFDPSPPDLTGSLGVHLWQQMFTRDKVDLNAEYPKTSLWEQWKEKYL